MAILELRVSSLVEPPRLAARPHHGRIPIPFVTLVKDGKPDFRVQDVERRQQCADERLCQLCGQDLGDVFVFVGWAGSVERRTFGEAPMHADCCDWAWEVCPFLAGGEYREIVVIDVVDVIQQASVSRYMAVYTTTDYTTIPDDEDSGSIKWLVAAALSIEWRDRQQPARLSA